MFDVLVGQKGNFAKDNVANELRKRVEREYFD